MYWYEKAYGFHYVALRYFNAAGATENFGEAHECESHLIPLVLRVAAGRSDSVEIFGSDYPTRDGTCVRDYVHVVDIARAHILAFATLEQRSSIYNIGCGSDGYTVRDVIDTARKVTGHPIPVRTGSRRPGDPATLIAANTKISSELGWSPTRQELGEIIESAWKWMLRHPNGYAES